MNNNTMIKTIILTLFTILFFSGCISLTKELPSYKTYSLEYNKEKKYELNSKSRYFDKTIQVFEAKSLASINSPAISYSKNSFLNEKYALSRWSDKPSKMIQRNIASYLTNTNSYKFVTTSNLKIKSDYKILLELVDFKHTFTENNSYADFSTRIYFINNNTDEVFFKSFVYNQKAFSNDAKGFVKAINSINNTFLYDLNNFIQEKL